MTLASVVISAAMPQPVGGLQVGEVVDVAVERGGDVGPVGAVDLVGCRAGGRWAGR